MTVQEKIDQADGDPSKDYLNGSYFSARDPDTGECYVYSWHEFTGRQWAPPMHSVRNWELVKEDIKI